MSGRSRSYCFTVNNYSSEEYDSILNTDCKYIIIGKEVGENLTPHLQGFVYLHQQTTISALKKREGWARAHLEATKGSIDQNIAYCSKEGSFESKGTKPMTPQEKGEEEKQRYHTTRLLAMEGKLDEIDSDIFIRHYNALKAIKKDNMVKPADLDGTCGIWIYGASGVGKSRKARADYPEAYDKLCNKWWDGYQDQENVIIDDFDPNHACLGHFLKRWADRYSFVAEVKGGAMNIRPKWIVVTSQYSIEECFPNDFATQDAIRRRFKVTHLTNFFATPPGLAPLALVRTQAMVPHFHLPIFSPITPTTDTQMAVADEDEVNTEVDEEEELSYDEIQDFFKYLDNDYNNYVNNK